MDAVAMLRVLNEETVLAGYPGGDRNQTLANVRSMRANASELLAALKAMREQFPTNFSSPNAEQWKALDAATSAIARPEGR